MGSPWRFAEVHVVHDVFASGKHPSKQAVGLPHGHTCRSPASPLPRGLWQQECNVNHQNFSYYLNASAAHSHFHKLNLASSNPGFSTWDGQADSSMEFYKKHRYLNPALDLLTCFIDAFVIFFGFGVCLASELLLYIIIFSTVEIMHPYLYSRCNISHLLWKPV